MQNNIPDTNVPKLPKIKNNVRFKMDSNENEDSEDECIRYEISKRDLLANALNRFDDYKYAESKRYDGYKMKNGLVVIAKLKQGDLFVRLLYNSEPSKCLFKNSPFEGTQFH